MLSTLSGIVIDVSFEQYLNVPSPMLVTLFGISTDVRRSQQSNARAPMLVTLTGIVIDVRLLRNPMRVVDKPSKVKKESSYYNAEQLNKLANAAKGSYIETPVILAMVLGLRRSEIVGITWDNVDFDNRLLHINQSVIVGDSSILPLGTYKVIGRTNSRKPKDIILKYFLKTESSERSFAMNDALYSYLKALKAEQDNMIRETNEYRDFLCVTL